MSMKVKQSTAAEVRERLAERKRKADAAAAPRAEYDLDARVAAMQEEDERKRVCS